jgi:hypothetical protein
MHCRRTGILTHDRIILHQFLHRQFKPVAAIALGLLMLMAASFHAVRRESDQTLLNALLLILLAVVVYSRWSLLP